MPKIMFFKSHWPKKCNKRKFIHREKQTQKKTHRNTTKLKQLKRLLSLSWGKKSKKARKKKLNWENKKGNTLQHLNLYNKYLLFSHVNTHQESKRDWIFVCYFLIASKRKEKKLTNSNVFYISSVNVNNSDLRAKHIFVYKFH